MTTPILNIALTSCLAIATVSESYSLTQVETISAKVSTFVLSAFFAALTYASNKALDERNLSFSKHVEATCFNVLVVVDKAANCIRALREKVNI